MLSLIVGIVCLVAGLMVGTWLMGITAHRMVERVARDLSWHLNPMCSGGRSVSDVMEHLSHCESTLRPGRTIAVGDAFQEAKWRIRHLVSG